MNITIYLLNKKAEVFTTYRSVSDALAFFNRTGRVKSYRIIICNGERARVIENPADTMMELSKNMQEIINTIK